MTKEKPKEIYYRDAAQHLNKVGQDTGEDVQNSLMLSFLTRGWSFASSQVKLHLCRIPGIQQLATRSMDEALRSFESVLAGKPTNLIALLGKVRVSFLSHHTTE
jgi:RNA polymerase-associated protein CTR9